MHTQSSRMFKAECEKLRQHKMHLYARMIVTMYLCQRYGCVRMRAHSHRLAVALENLDK